MHQSKQPIAQLEDYIKIRTRVVFSSWGDMAQG